MAGILSRLATLPISYLAMWGTLVALTVGLVVMMRTRWGRERPTPRYLMLSVIGHLLLICLATTVRFFTAPVGEPDSAPVKVRIVMRTPSVAAQPEPVVVPPPEPVVVKTSEEKPTPEPESQPEISPELESISEPEQTVEPEPEQPPPVDSLAAETQAESIPAESPTSESDIAESPSEPESAEPQLLDSPATEPQPNAQQPESIPQQETPPPIEPIPAPPSPAPPLFVESTAIPLATEPQATMPQATVPKATAPTWQPGVVEPVAVPAPATPYGARTLDERWRLVEREGGSRATEDAVAAALDWLAAAQSNDGRWDADRWAGGRERHVLGHNRRSAGINADAGVTGLALLAMMGAGHTHADGGPYAEPIRAGLEYLLRSQAADGDLAGNATLFARTYCHSMATFALAEALAHTRDERLIAAVERGVRFLVDRQHVATGGWRYRPGQPGDMSQMGWVIMALRSAELGGVRVPLSTWAGIERFVDSVRRGDRGGLASYRRDGPVSRTMTAEALYCRQILGASVLQEAGDEAIGALIGAPPGAGQANLYYWYYATLALHHHRRANGYADTAWRAWNEALTRSLVASQVRDGANTGSWSPSTLWGGYGGRVYSTAVAAMCLEVYYRYDPQQLVRDPWIAARPGAGSLR